MPNYMGRDLINLGRETEQEVAKILRSQGHKVEPATERHYDLLCDGTIRLEIKVAYPTWDGELVWAFNNRKRFSDYCDILILVASIEGHFLHYILPAGHPIFYKANGQPKAGIGITSKPKRKLRQTGMALEYHKEKWGLVNEIRNGTAECPQQGALF